jgi:hypothetical protein
MLSIVRRRLLAWLIRRYPGVYLRRKHLDTHALARQPEFLSLQASLVESGEGISSLPERYNLWALTRSLAHRPGACAEVGVYRGGSALLIAAAKGEAPLHLFDTFAGMPRTDATADGAFFEGQFRSTSLGTVQALLSPWPGIHYHAGLFPATARGLEHLRFKFVHLDVDIRQSTLAGLEFFYPRMERGGLILIHDYQNLTVPGTRAAVDEFLADKPETLIPLWETQGLIVKA